MLERLSLYHPWLPAGLAAVLAVCVALVIHGISARVLLRLVKGRPVLSAMLKAGHEAARLVLVLIALQLTLSGAEDTLPGIVLLRTVTRLLLIGAVTWLAMRASTGFGRGILGSHPLDVADNRQARRIHTQTNVLVRCVNTGIGVAGLAAMLMTFPEVRQIGASLMASAGLIGIVAGFAARPVFGNLIAGLQIALTQPIALDDVLIVQGEWGRVEEITGAYVVVRIWDERRLIVPLQWFIENPFQNWTRHASQLIGSVFVWVDYRTPLAPLRAELRRLCEAATEWDSRVCVLQVTDSNDRAMQLRALVSSADSGRNWDLRCKVREGLVAYIQRHHPDCLPRLRADLGGDPDRAGRSNGAPSDLKSPSA